jgi:hypothetical protein
MQSAAIETAANAIKTTAFRTNPPEFFGEIVMRDSMGWRSEAEGCQERGDGKTVATNKGDVKGDAACGRKEREVLRERDLQTHCEQRRSG